MIRYNTTDIIKRAEQLADMENSDFISDYEKIALLNESWQIIYQKIINANDKTWLKRVRVCDGMKLPGDLYQISSIYVEKSLEQLNKKNPSQKYGYEVINGKIYISDNYNGCRIVMDYFPIPKSLKLREKKVDAPFEIDILGANHSLYIDSDSYIHDINDGDVNFKIGSNFYDYAMFDNATLAVVDSNYTSFAWWDYDGISSKPSVQGTVIPLVIENSLYLYNSLSHKIYDTNNNEYLQIELTVPQYTKYIYCDNDFNNVYYFTPTGYYYNDSDFINLADRKLKLAWSNNRPYVILRNTNRIVRCDKDQVRIIEVENVPVTFVSDRYVLTRKRMSSLAYLEGYIEDTELDFNNNLYFIVLSYMLAISFKNKQGSDTTALYEQYQGAVQQLFDSISNDANGFYQIKNVYKGGRYLW